MALRNVTGFTLIAATVLASGVASVDANVVKVAVLRLARPGPGGDARPRPGCDRLIRCPHQPPEES